MEPMLGVAKVLRVGWEARVNGQLMINAAPPSSLMDFLQHCSTLDFHLQDLWRSLRLASLNRCEAFGSLGTLCSLLGVTCDLIAS